MYQDTLRRCQSLYTSPTDCPIYGIIYRTFALFSRVSTSCRGGFQIHPQCQHLHSSMYIYALLILQPIHKTSMLLIYPHCTKSTKLITDYWSLPTVHPSLPRRLGIIFFSDYHNHNYHNTLQILLCDTEKSTQDSPNSRPPCKYPTTY